MLLLLAGALIFFEIPAKFVLFGFVAVDVFNVFDQIIDDDDDISVDVIDDDDYDDDDDDDDDISDVAVVSVGLNLLLVPVVLP